MRRVPTLAWCGVAVVVLLLGWVPVATADQRAERALGELETFEHWAESTVVVTGTLVDVGVSQELVPSVWDTPLTYRAEVEGAVVLVATSVSDRVTREDADRHLELRIDPGRIRAGEVRAVQAGETLPDADDLVARQQDRLGRARTVATVALGAWWVSAALAVVALLLVGRARGASGFAGERRLVGLGRYDALDRASRSWELPVALGGWCVLSCFAAVGFAARPLAVAWIALTVLVVTGAAVRELRAVRALAQAPPGIVHARRRPRALLARAAGLLPLLLSGLLGVMALAVAAASGRAAGIELSLAAVLSLVGVVWCASGVVQARLPQPPVIPPTANSGTLAQR